MAFILKIKKCIGKDWVIALALTLIYYLTHGYRFAWDDQNLEIPLLKSLMDPGLYTRDYFVQSLKVNFTTYFYWLLSKLISIDQIEPTYFILFFLSRFFMFFWMYKFWLHVSGEKWIGFLCVMSFLVLMRLEMFLYWSFSHAELTLAIVFAGFYFFYKDRFYVAALIIGIATNFNALFAAFLMIYILIYLALNYKKHGLLVFVKSLGIYLLFSMPFLLWFLYRILFQDINNVGPLISAGREITL